MDLVQHSLLYVSKSTLGAREANEAARQIASGSVQVNARLGLTGALIFTGEYFAQIIEGCRPNIDELMVKIGQDPRHTDLKIVDRNDEFQRRFSDWSMAYIGPSQFVSRHVLQLLEPSSAERKWRAAKWMSELMAEFSSAV